MIFFQTTANCVSSKSVCTTGLDKLKHVLGHCSLSQQNSPISALLSTLARDSGLPLMCWGLGWWLDIKDLVINYSNCYSLPQPELPGFKAVSILQSINLPLAYWANHMSLTDVILITQLELQREGSEESKWLWSVFKVVALSCLRGKDMNGGSTPSTVLSLTHGVWASTLSDWTYWNLQSSFASILQVILCVFTTWKVWKPKLMLYVLGL